MKRKIIGFIDYFPNESGFVIPIFEYFDSYYVQKVIKSFVTNVQIDLDIEYIDKNNNYIIINNDIILETNDMIYAFKINKDLIVIGKQNEISKTIIYSIGNLKNNIGLQDDIKFFMKYANQDINKYKRVHDITNSKLSQAAKEYAHFLVAKQNYSYIPPVNKGRISYQFILNTKKLVSLNPIFLLLRNGVHPAYDRVRNMINDEYSSIMKSISKVKTKDVVSDDSIDPNNISQVYDIFRKGDKNKIRTLKKIASKSYSNDFMTVGELRHSKGYTNLTSKKNNSTYIKRIDDFFTTD